MAYRSVSVYLEDALMAIEQIKRFVEKINSAKEYLQQEIVQRATERDLEIIAEAVKNALKSEPQLAFSNKKKIIGLRNIINHQYYEVDHEVIWKIVQNDLPVLEQEIRQVLDDFERKLELNEL